jgi:hypothetical protein
MAIVQDSRRRGLAGQAPSPDEPAGDWPLCGAGGRLHRRTPVVTAAEAARHIDSAVSVKNYYQFKERQRTQQPVDFPLDAIPAREPKKGNGGYYQPAKQRQQQATDKQTALQLLRSRRFDGDQKRHGPALAQFNCGQQREKTRWLRE